MKEIHSCQYITCMNPTAGSFSVNPRLQVGEGEREREGEVTIINGVVKEMPVVKFMVRLRF